MTNNQPKDYQLESIRSKLMTLYAKRRSVVGYFSHYVNNIAFNRALKYIYSVYNIYIVKYREIYSFYIVYIF